MPIFFFLKDHLSFCCTNFQRSVQPVPHFVTFNIVSRCFQSINNNCCKNAICLLFTNILATLLLRRLSCRVVNNGFVNSKQMAFLQNFVSKQLLFLFSEHLDTMSNVMDCGPVEQIFYPRIL